MVRHRTVLMLLSVAAVVCLLISTAEAQETWVEKTKSEIAKLQKALEKAKDKGRWKQYIELQKRISALYEKLEHGRKEAGGEAAGDDIAAWVEKLEKRLMGMEPEVRIKALERLLVELKASGPPEKAMAARRLLESLRQGKGRGAQEHSEALERKIDRLREKAEKAEEKFAFEKADKLRAEIRALEARIPAPPSPPRDWHDEALGILEETIGKFRGWIEEVQKRGDAGMARDMEEGLAFVKSFWEKIERCRTPEAMEALSGEIDGLLEKASRDIPLLKEKGKAWEAECNAWIAGQFKRIRSLMAGRGRRERGPSPGRNEALAMIEEVARRFSDLMRTFRQAGNEEAARDIEESLGRVRAFGEAIRRSRPFEIAERVLPELEKATGKLHGQLEEAEETGQMERAELIRWVLERMERVHGLLARETEGEASPFVGKASGILEELRDRFKAWSREYEERGEKKTAEGLLGAVGEMEEFARMLKRVRSPETMERALRQVEEGMKNIEKGRKEALQAGDVEEAKRIGWVLERMKKVKQLLGMARKEALEGPKARGPRGREKEIERMLREAEALEAEGRIREARMLRRKAEVMERTMGPREERGGRWHGKQGEEGRREIARLREAMRRAQREGDRERAEAIRERLRDLREGERPREGGREKALDFARETARLRQEIAEIKREMKELKELLKQLLKQGKRKKDD